MKGTTTDCTRTSVPFLIFLIFHFVVLRSTAFSYLASIETPNTAGNGLLKQSSLSMSSQSKTLLRYTNGFDEDAAVTPHELATRRSSFLSRMKNIVMRSNSKTTTMKEESSQNEHSDVLVKVVHTLEEFQELIRCNRENQQNSPIIVIRWYATWCKACKVIQPLYYKMARSYQEDSKKVMFVQIPLTEKNTDLHQEFVSLPSLPYGHIYHPTHGLVEELKLMKPHFRRFEQTIQWYVNGVCDLPDNGDCSFPFGSEWHEGDDNDEVHY